MPDDLYHPITFLEFEENEDPTCPFRFFKKTPPATSATPPTESQPIAKDIASTKEIIPSFCRAPRPDELPRPQETPLPTLAPNSFPVTPIPYHAPILGMGLSSREQTGIKPIKPKEPHTTKPRAYDIAMELMAVQPLRMVDNALYAYDGQVYRFVDMQTMNRLIMRQCRPYVHAVGDASIIEKIYKVIQAEPNICMPSVGGVPLIALDDGVLDLATFTLHPFSPEPFVTVKLNGSYTRGESATCPVFDAFLSHVTGGDPILTERIWQAVGYSIVPDTNGKCFILLQGVPDSGKSLLGDIIASLVDLDLVTSLDVATMGERFGASELVGKQLCLALDLPSGPMDSKATSTFKQLTGGDFVTADVKYQPRIRFRCTATFVFATNHALLTRDPDPAFLRRAVTIPFRHEVEKAYQDRTLKDRILTERDAILYRAIQAYGRLRQTNYQFTGNFTPNEAISCQDASNCNLHDSLWNFCQQCCVLDKDAFVPTNELYEAFCAFTKATWPGGVRGFSEEILGVLRVIFPLAASRGEIDRDRRHIGGSNIGKNNLKRGIFGITLTTTGGTFHA